MEHLDLGNGFTVQRRERVDDAACFRLYENQELLHDDLDAFGALDLARREGANPDLVFEAAKKLCYAEDAVLLRPKN